ncbi:CoA pyrophosphatase [Salinisphaera sp. LB1]|uniref:CoA pyrophosphatase n=1 Tax=Salinisphaera sp. LB1 TaxID=2183911 RepID=UPI000D7DE915|nr:CoA pyrophosphatase [Salinisphaera sp. LB1]AWN17409.1 putative nudix hydrolase YeaB [Salinisphaera sp. LB1]
MAWRRLLEAAVAHAGPADTRLQALDARRARHAARPAAVLIGVEAASEPRIYFTQRTQGLTHHPGQISFPGGRIDPGDSSPADAALRECHEEIGLAREAVTLLGGLPCYRTVTGFEIKPFVGWIEPGQMLQPDGVEIERIFAVPLAYAMDSAHYRSEERRRDDVCYRVYSIDFEGHHIWGATAAMLMELAQRVARAAGRPFFVADVAGISDQNGRF